ncbi:uncharacterized protein si:dkey-9i23.16 isoform X2 [Clupea harengus]|nr:uncharacterized protein si:dkey-9i23.16 isoform X2 [Clupea harengus]
MVLSTQADSLEKSSKLRIFRQYDPEAAAVVSILLGLFQVLLAAPVYFIKFRPFFYVLPLIIGVLFVTGGSFAVACCKYPDRRLLKSCAYSNLACLLGALVAVCVYIMALSTELPHMDCSTVENDQTLWGSDYDMCIHFTSRLHQFYHGLVGSLLVYDIAAMVLHSLLSYSAVKRLKVA